MLFEGLSELLGLNDQEIMKLIVKARLEKKEEIEFVVDGEPIRIKFNHISSNRVMDRMADGW